MANCIPVTGWSTLFSGSSLLGCQEKLHNTNDRFLDRHQPRHAYNTQEYSMEKCLPVTKSNSRGGVFKNNPTVPVAVTETLASPALENPGSFK